MSTSSALRHVDSVTGLAELQRGVVTRRQLRALGINSNDVRNQLEAHRWSALGHQVVVLQTGALDEEQQRWAAVLRQAPGAALAGITAAQASGLRWWAPETMHVIVPFGRRIVRCAGVQVHASRTYRGVLDQHPTLLPPRTPIERSVIDAASWAVNDRRACGVLCAAVQQRLTTADRLAEAFEDAGPVRRRRLIRLTLGDILGGADSFAEIDMSQLALRAGLWAPLQQAKRRDADGRIRWLDNDFGGFQAEVDGALHLLPENYWDDMDRQNELTIGGSHVLRFSTMAIRLRPERVMGQLRRAADVFGRTPPRQASLRR